MGSDSIPARLNLKGRPRVPGKVRRRLNNFLSSRAISLLSYEESRDRKTPNAAEFVHLSKGPRYALRLNEVIRRPPRITTRRSTNNKRQPIDIIAVADRARGGSNRDRTAVRIGRPPPPSRLQLVPYVDENPPSKPSFSPASRFCWLRASCARNDVPGVHPVRVDLDGNNRT